MDIDIALEKIYSLKQFHIKLGLDNIKHLLAHIDNPHEKLKTIHIAGSNGKGSTCSFLASILQEAGFKVGLYTSPHFIRFNERIRINGVEIPDSSIIKFLDSQKHYIDKFKPTFFEITTALAFQYYFEQNVDYAIIETGLGGRLDATNVLVPLASVITSISLEHSHILGDTLEKIAFEKGGIIKKKVPVFTGVLPSEAESKIDEISNNNHSLVYGVRNYHSWEADLLSLNLNRGRFLIHKTGLRGSHQQRNAALAVLTLDKIFKDSLSFETFNRGIQNVVENTGIQGRYEKHDGKNTIIYDSAHNLEGVEIFIEEFRKEYRSYSKCTLIFGAMKDKEIGSMLKLLSPLFDNIIVTSTKYERAASTKHIKDIADNLNIFSQISDSPVEVIKSFKEELNNECLVILGSIYLIGQIKKELEYLKLT